MPISERLARVVKIEIDLSIDLLLAGADLLPDGRAGGAGAAQIDCLVRRESDDCSDNC